MDHIPKPKILTLDPNDDNIILEIPEDRDPNAKEEPMKKEKVSYKIRSYLNNRINSDVNTRKESFRCLDVFV